LLEWMLQTLNLHSIAHQGGQMFRQTAEVVNAISVPRAFGCCLEFGACRGFTGTCGRCTPRAVRMSDCGQVVGVKHGGLQLTATVRRYSLKDREAVYILDTASRCFPYSLGSMAWPNSANWHVLTQFFECAISSGAITLLPRLWDRSRM